MRGGRIVLAAAVSVGVLGAGDAPRSVAIEDPCGDMVAVRTDDERHSAQPEDWDRNDLAGLTVTEVRDEDAVTAGVDLVVGFCADAEEASRYGERVMVRWDLDDRCHASVDIAPATERTDLGGGISVRPGPAGPELVVSCFDGWLVGIGERIGAVDLDPSSISRAGRALTVQLRAAELGELGHLVSSGATIAARADSYAMIGTGIGPTVRSGSLVTSIHAGTADGTATTEVLTLGE